MTACGKAGNNRSAGLMMKKIKKQKKRGFTLVEIMVAILLLVVLAMGGAAVLYQTGGGVQVQGNKRVALELANQRLEVAKAQYYNDMTPPGTAYNQAETYYLTDADSDGVLELKTAGGKTIISDTLVLDGISYVMQTEVIRWNAEAVPGFNTEHLEITASVTYRAGSDDTVSLSTRIIPPQLIVE